MNTNADDCTQSLAQHAQGRYPVIHFLPRKMAAWVVSICVHPCLSVVTVCMDSGQGSRCTR
jgi:hypothetical protein